MHTTHRKRFALALSLLIALGVAAGAQAREDGQNGMAGGITIPIGRTIDADASTQTPEAGLQPGTSLTVGTSSALTGALGLSCFGASAADLDAQALLHGYGLVAQNGQDGFFMDPTVVVDVERTVDADGGRVYTFTLSESLVYNDGTPITAADYAFSMLLCCAPELLALGARHSNCDHVQGNAAYRAGDTKRLAGVRLLSEHTLSIRLEDEHWPMFYGIAMLRVLPRPIHVIAPGCAVRDDGEGVYLEGDFTTALLAQTLLDSEHGYLHSPTVTSGPYMLEAYDKAGQEAFFVANQRYQGNHEGETPRIERLRMRPATGTGTVDMLAQGEVDLLNRVSDAVSVLAGQDLASGAAGFAEATYLRDGLVALYFACDMAPTDAEPVRRALTMALDRSAFVTAHGGPSAHRVYGYYGLGQWMASYTLTREDGSSVKVEDLLPQLDVSYDPQEAAALLASDGWTLNYEGRPYEPGVDDTRHKQTEAGLMPLTLRWAKTEGSNTADALEEALQAAFAEIGASLTIDAMPFDRVLSHFLRREEEDRYHLFLMGNNFDHVYDPAFDFNTEADAFFNACGLKDEALNTLARQLRHVSATTPDHYVARWLQYQVRLMETLPIMPLYSNVYFDFYTDALVGYDVTRHASWGEAILYAGLRQASDDAQ